MNYKLLEKIFRNYLSLVDDEQEDKNFDKIKNEVKSLTMAELSYIYYLCGDVENKNRNKKTGLFKMLVKITGPDFIMTVPKSVQRNEYHVPLLFYVANINNVILVGILINSGANINILDTANNNVLKTCIEGNNFELLKYFVNKGVNINNFNNENSTNVIHAITSGHHEMILYLIKNNGDFVTDNFGGISPLKVITAVCCERQYHKNLNLPSDIYDECLEHMIFHREMNNETIEYIAIQLLQANIINKNLVELLNKMPSLINKYKILESLFLKNNNFGKELEDIIVIVNKNKNCMPPEKIFNIIEMAFATCNERCARLLLCDNKDNSISLLKNTQIKNTAENNDSYSIYEHIFASYYITDSESICDYTKPAEKIINMIKLLMEFNININEKWGKYLPLEYAIMYSNEDVIKGMIDLGANINVNINKKQVLSFAGNYDLLSLGANSFDKFKFLIDHNIKPQYIHISKNIKLPTCLISSILKNDDDVFEYIYQNMLSDEQRNNKYINRFLEKVIKYELSENNGFNMLKLIGCQQTTEYPFYVENIIKKFIDLPVNITQRLSLYEQLLNFLDIITSTLSINGNDMDEIYEIIEKYEKFMDFAENNELTSNKFINLVLYVGDFQNKSLIKKYLNIISSLVVESNSSITLPILNDKHFKKRVDNIMNSKTYKKNAEKNLDVKYFGYMYNWVRKKGCYMSFMASDNFRDDLIILIKCLKKINMKQQKLVDNSKGNLYRENISINDEKILENDTTDDYYDYITNLAKDFIVKEERKSEPESGSELEDDIGELANKTKRKRRKNKKAKCEKKDKENNNILKQQQKITANDSSDNWKLVLGKSDVVKKMDPIKTLLFKLYFPIKFSQYDKLYNELRSTPIYSDFDDKIVFEYSGKIYTILKINNKIVNKKPSSWIKHYGQNIGIPEKNDFSHDIPYWIDGILLNMNCYEDTIQDITKINDNANSKLLYFYGSIRENNIVKDGVFEYFLDSNNTLFHRMFREKRKFTPNIPDIF
jgi:ankyrin repeat protein